MTQKLLVIVCLLFSGYVTAEIEIQAGSPLLVNDDNTLYVYNAEPCKRWGFNKECTFHNSWFQIPEAQSLLKIINGLNDRISNLENYVVELQQKEK